MILYTEISSEIINKFTDIVKKKSRRIGYGYI